MYGQLHGSPFRSITKGYVKLTPANKASLSVFISALLSAQGLVELRLVIQLQGSGHARRWTKFQTLLEQTMLAAIRKQGFSWPRLQTLECSNLDFSAAGFAELVSWHAPSLRALKFDQGNFTVAHVESLALRYWFATSSIRPYWMFAKRALTGEVVYWRAAGNECRGLWTNIWRFKHGLTGEVAYGHNPYEFWPQFNDRDEATGDAAEPTPFSDDFEIFVRFGPDDMHQPCRATAPPPNAITFNKAMEEDLVRHGIWGLVKF
ncbi:hypothetical protein Micbo1qcDRAFT_178068 [Microdochium bolleyi]|uniref:Uncharacterized protein n=1 Tax=Microdochium bolleyi TaxID=196109 RepID=A0A136IUC6_9PEZI|nr:hypothetical protein Micbo1qcDRAFT_178068 [Microdochium bolleyi]